MTRTFGFETRAEANAFIQGVEFVNDSAVEVVGYPECDSEQDRWIVTIEDTDAMEDLQS